MFATKHRCMSALGGRPRPLGSPLPKPSAMDDELAQNQFAPCDEALRLNCSEGMGDSSLFQQDFARVSRTLSNRRTCDGEASFRWAAFGDGWSPRDGEEALLVVPMPSDFSRESRQSSARGYYACSTSTAADSPRFAQSIGVGQVLVDEVAENSEASISSTFSEDFADLREWLESSY